MCLYNTLTKNPKYKRSEKNMGVIPPMADLRVSYVPLGCGQCIECRKKKARDWQLRLSEDIKTNTNGKFITLTFSNESIKKLDEQLTENIKRNGWKKQLGEVDELKGYDRDNAIATLGIRYFTERWTKRYGKALRHWLITELGHEGTENIHLHGIIWTDRDWNRIEKIWNYGFIWPNSEIERKRNWVNGRTVNYIIKYVTQVDERHKYYKPKVLTSAGIGNNYPKTLNGRINKYKGKDTIETYRTETGHKITIPIYWRNKIYTEEEREKLWLLKLDKLERWVNKEKVSIKDGYEQYDKLLEHHRELNKELGYGDGVKNWKREYYENKRREILLETRIKNTNAPTQNRNHAQAIRPAQESPGSPSP